MMPNAQSGRLRSSLPRLRRLRTGSNHGSPSQDSEQYPFMPSNCTSVQGSEISNASFGQLIDLIEQLGANST